MHKKTKPIIMTICVAALILLITGCGDGSPRTADTAALIARPGAAQLVAQQPTSVVPVRGPTSAAIDQNAMDIPAASQQRVVLKNATLALTVDDPAKSVMTITQMAEQMGGWVVNSNATMTERDGHRLAQATISIPLPAVQFSRALEQIKVGTVSVESENIAGDDVTQK